MGCTYLVTAVSFVTTEQYHSWKHKRQTGSLLLEWIEQTTCDQDSRLLSHILKAKIMPISSNANQLHAIYPTAPVYKIIIIILDTVVGQKPNLLSTKENDFNISLLWHAWPRRGRCLADGPTTVADIRRQPLRQTQSLLLEWIEQKHVIRILIAHH